MDVDAAAAKIFEQAAQATLSPDVQVNKPGTLIPIFDFNAFKAKAVEIVKGDLPWYLKMRKEVTTMVRQWVGGIISSIFGGFLVAQTTMVIDPKTFNFAEGFGYVAAVGGLAAFFNLAHYLAQSPLPGVNLPPNVQPGQPTKT